MANRLFFLFLCGVLGFIGASVYYSFRVGQSVEAQTTAWNYGRSFYLTSKKFQGNAASNACAAGYHMASLFEIHEPAILKYNTNLGVTNTDSGSGPPSVNSPSVYYAWVRTGNASRNQNGAFPGTSNCAAWTDNSQSDYGTTVGLQPVWTNNSGNTASIWVPSSATCASSMQVWCVQN